MTNAPASQGEFSVGIGELGNAAVRAAGSRFGVGSILAGLTAGGASFAASAENGGGFTVKKMYGDFKERLYGVWRTSGGGYIEWGDMGQFNSVRRDYIFEHYMEYAGDINVSEDNTGYHVSLPEMTVHDEYTYEKYDLRTSDAIFKKPLRYVADIACNIVIYAPLFQSRQ